MNILKKAKKLLGEANFLQSVECLQQSWLHKNGLLEDVLLVQSRYHRNENQFQKGLLLTEQYRVEETRIYAALMQEINHIEQQSHQQHGLRDLHAYLFRPALRHFQKALEQNPNYLQVFHDACICELGLAQTETDIFIVLEKMNLLEERLVEAINIGLMDDPALLIIVLYNRALIRQKIGDQKWLAEDMEKLKILNSSLYKLLDNN